MLYFADIIDAKKREIFMPINTLQFHCLTYLSAMVVDVFVSLVYLDGLLEILETLFRIFLWVFALLNKEGGPLDERVHPETGFSLAVVNYNSKIFKGLILLLAQNVEGGSEKRKSGG